MTTAVAPDSTTKRLYHIGLDPKCPVDIVTAGGHALCKLTETISFDRHKNTKRNERTGEAVSLTDADVARIKAAVDRLAIRTTGAGKPISTVIRVGLKDELARIKIEDKDGIQVTTPIYESRRLKDFDPATDQPLAPWVYLRAIDAIPGEAVPDDRLPLPAWAKPKDSKAEAPAKAPAKK